MVDTLGPDACSALEPPTPGGPKTGAATCRVLDCPKCLGGGGGFLSERAAKGTFCLLHRQRLWLPHR